NADEFGSGLDSTLRAQRFVKEHPHGIQNSIALRDCFLLSQNFLLGENALAFAEFAAEKDGLLDEGKMLALFVDGASAGLLARVAAARVRPEAGPRSRALGGADRRLRLGQRRIGLQSQSLQDGLRQDRFASRGLRASVRQRDNYVALVAHAALGLHCLRLSRVGWRILLADLSFTLQFGRLHLRRAVRSSLRRPAECE